MFHFHGVPVDRISPGKANPNLNEMQTSLSRSYLLNNTLLSMFMGFVSFLKTDKALNGHWFFKVQK